MTNHSDLRLPNGRRWWKNAVTEESNLNNTLRYLYLIIFEGRYYFAQIFLALKVFEVGEDTRIPKECLSPLGIEIKDRYIRVKMEDDIQITKKNFNFFSDLLNLYSPSQYTHVSLYISFKP